MPIRCREASPASPSASRENRLVLTMFSRGLRSDKRSAERAFDLHRSSALGGIRTPNLLIRSQMLYPLSYQRRGNEQCTGRRSTAGEAASLAARQGASAELGLTTQMNQ